MGKRKIRARKGDTLKERERMPERCMKIVQKTNKTKQTKNKQKQNNFFHITKT